MANKYLIIYPDGSISEREDTGNEDGYRNLKTELLGTPTDYTYITHEPFIIFAAIKDEGLLDGSPMQRSNLLKGLAGPVILSFASATEEGRGFTEDELEYVTDLIQFQGWMTKEEAEAGRPEFDDEPF